VLTSLKDDMVYLLAHEGDLHVHPIRVLEMDASNATEVIDLPGGCARSYQAIPHLMQRILSVHLQGKVIYPAPLSDLAQFRFRISLRNLEDVEKRLRPEAEEIVPVAWRIGIPESGDHRYIQNLIIEADQSIEVGRLVSHMIDTGDEPLSQRFTSPSSALKPKGRAGWLPGACPLLRPVVEDVKVDELWLSIVEFL
jgi:hypothetical protein